MSYRTPVAIQLFMTQYLPCLGCNAKLNFVKNAFRLSWFKSFALEMLEHEY